MRSDRRALIVGIRTYETLGELQYTENDALAMYEALSSYNCQFSCELLGSEASAKLIRDKFRGLFIGADSDAIILFYFAGHAVTVDGGTYLITSDTEFDVESGVYFRRLVDVVSELRQPDQVCVFILDCCRAGALPVEQIPVSLTSLQGIVASSSGITLLAASEEDKLAVERDALEHGLFTYWLLQGLEGNAATIEGKITIASLQDYVANVMNQRAYKQRIVYKTTVIGASPILGDGFAPKGDNSSLLLSSEQRSEIDNETRNLLNQLEEDTKVDHATWTSENYRKVSKALSSLVLWRNTLRAKHPELKCDNEFLYFDGEIMRLQTKLANLEPGTVVSEGEIVSQIGSGGFGTVYQINTAQGLKAYKVYHANQLHDRDKVKAFLRGHGAMVELKGHPNIVQVGEQTTAPLGFYMDYINGANFRTWWFADIEKLLTVLHIVAQTLCFAHNHPRKIVHRDIKPENILIAENNEGQPIPYLTDFDLSWYSMSTVYSSIGKSAVAAFGHYLYAAPEQYERPGDEITRKTTTDVYGFGQLCYFAVTGKDPATLTEHSVESLKAHLSKWNSEEAAKKYIDLYTRSTQRTPSKRYQSMDDVSDVILDIRRILLDPDKNKSLTPEQFLKELIFALFGFELEPTTSFASKSQRTSVELTKIDPRKIEIRLGVNVGYLAMTGSYEQQRNSANKRLDTVLASKEFQDIDAVRRTEGTTNVFNCSIQIDGNYLHLEGVRRIRELILALIKAIEA